MLMKTKLWINDVLFELFHQDVSQLYTKAPDKPSADVT